MGLVISVRIGRLETCSVILIQRCSNENNIHVFLHVHIIMMMLPTIQSTLSFVNLPVNFPDRTENQAFISEVSSDIEQRHNKILLIHIAGDLRLADLLQNLIQLHNVNFSMIIYDSSVILTKSQ